MSGKGRGEEVKTRGGLVYRLRSEGEGEEGRSTGGVEKKRGRRGRAEERSGVEEEEELDDQR